MRSDVFHRFRRRSRRIATAAVAVFVLNWLGLALMPCAMAYAVPVAASVAAPAADAPAMPAGCPGHPAAVSTPGAQEAPATKAPCPWCLATGNAAQSGAGGPHDRDCAVVPKPALDARDSKTPATPLLIALSAAVLGFVLPEAAAGPALTALDPQLPPDAPASDRYCRRLE